MPMRANNHLAGLVVAIGAGIGLYGSADAAPRARPVARAVPAVVVDVSRLRDLGLGQTADLIQVAITDELAKTFPNGSGAPGTTVVVRITGLSLDSWAGSSDGGGGGGTGGGGSGNGTNTDFLQGEGLIVGQNGAVIQRYPEVLALPASYGGPYTVAGNEQRRIVGLARTFVQWFRRSVA